MRPTYRFLDGDALTLVVINHLFRIGSRRLVGIGATIVMLNSFYDRVDALPTIRSLPTIKDVPDHNEHIA